MRITLDIDQGYSELKVLMAYYNLRRLGEVELRRSSSGYGYHMIVRGLQITYEDSLRIRAMLGECPTRLRFDEEPNMKIKQILWSAKIINGKRLQARVITERDLLALPFLSKIHGGWYRCGRQFSG